MLVKITPTMGGLGYMVTPELQADRTELWVRSGNNSMFWQEHHQEFYEAFSLSAEEVNELEGGWRVYKQVDPWIFWQLIGLEAG